MKIRFKKYMEGNSLLIEADHSKEEDSLIRKWYNQIMDHMNSLNLNKENKE
jgi:hypothetical protein